MTEETKSRSAPSSPVRPSLWGDPSEVTSTTTYNNWYHSSKLRTHRDPMAPFLPKDYPYEDIPIPQQAQRQQHRPPPVVGSSRSREEDISICLIRSLLLQHKFVKIVRMVVKKVKRIQRFLRDSLCRMHAVQVLAVKHIRRIFPTTQRTFMTAFVEEYSYQLNVENYARAIVRSKYAKNKQIAFAPIQCRVRKCVLQEDEVLTIVTKTGEHSDLGNITSLSKEAQQALSECTKNSDALGDLSKCFSVVMQNEQRPVAKDSEEDVCEDEDENDEGVVAVRNVNELHRVPAVPDDFVPPPLVPREELYWPDIIPVNPEDVGFEMNDDDDDDECRVRGEWKPVLHPAPPVQASHMKAVHFDTYDPSGWAVQYLPTLDQVQRCQDRPPTPPVVVARMVSGNMCTDDGICFVCELPGGITVLCEGCKKQNIHHECAHEDSGTSYCTTWCFREHGGK